MEHIFSGSWITDGEFANLSPRNVFHKQLERVDLPCEAHRDRHILFRRQFVLERKPENAALFITADDYYKLYINGCFVTQGPTAAYHFRYGYNTVDVSAYLSKGVNTIAVHTLYQGLINRVWVSGDQRHGLICDLIADGCLIVKSDESFLTHPHTAYTETGTVGYQTQFLERYDSRAREVGFQKGEFDDSYWEHASLKQNTDYTLTAQPTKQLAFETVTPVLTERRGNVLLVDFGSTYVGYVKATLRGKAGDTVEIRCGQELNTDGSVRYKLRCNCEYKEEWILSGGKDKLDWFDYKSLRYAEFSLPEDCEVISVSFNARHYPFSCTAQMKPALQSIPEYRRVWELCVHSIRYGVQEVIQDCMDREKGFYVGDGCYTALTHFLLTGDDGIVRKLIDDAFASTFITPGMVTCLDCSMMQEIAEYPLMLISLILWHYRLTGDRAYLAQNYRGVTALLEDYRTHYEQNGLLGDLDKWCLVEWPKNFQDGYAVDVTEGKVCHTPHIAINAYYIEAIHCANQMAQVLGLPEYRSEEAVRSAIIAAFYDRERHIFTDSAETRHASYIGNALAFAFRLQPDAAFEANFIKMAEDKGITGVSFFGAFPLLYGLIRHGRRDIAEKMLIDEGAWLRTIREGATTTYEGWGRDTKWNTSLFHLTMSDAVVFMTDIDLEALFA